MTHRFLPLIVAVAALAPAALLAQTEAPADTVAADAGPRNGRLRVVDPFLEMHTGPGRGFPVFFVAEREEWITIELRHTDWYKVRTASGRLGWVPREQLARTLTEAGEGLSFGDTQLDDYLRRRFDVGAGGGSWKGESIMRFWAGWRFSDTMTVELDAAQVQATFSSTNLWHLNLMSEPWSDQRFSPFFGIGLGSFHYNPNDSLVDNQKVDNKLGVFTFGARYHLTGRFALRADYSMYSANVSDFRTRAYRGATVGLSVHF